MVLAVTVTVGFPLPAWTEVPRGEDPHGHFEKPGFCSRCHVLVEGKPDPGRFIAEADTFCLDCHRDEELGGSHPRNVRPGDRYRKMKVPEDYTLDDHGRILCLTCHKGHGTFLSTVQAFPRQTPEAGASPGGTSRYKTFYLRRSDPEQGFAPLCGGCHPSL